MSEDVNFAEKISEAWEVLHKRKNILDNEIFKDNINLSQKRRELKDVEEAIEKIRPISDLKWIFNYVQSCKESAKT